MGFEIDVVLTCTSKKSTEKKTIRIDEAPQTVLDVKRLIQKQFSVPICVQEFTYESQRFVDTASLKSISLRSGDTVHVSYPSEADCAAIDKVLAWLQQVVLGLRNGVPSVRDPAGAQLRVLHLIHDGLNGRLLEDLAYVYFGTFGEAGPTVNRLYFMQANGICLLVELLTLAQKVAWPERLAHMKWVELGCLQVLWSICESREFGEVVCMHSGLECCVKALSHKKLDGCDTFSDDDSPQPQRTNEVLEGVMVAGLGTLRK